MIFSFFLKKQTKRDAELLHHCFRQLAVVNIATNSLVEKKLLRNAKIYIEARKTEINKIKNAKLKVFRSNLLSLILLADKDLKKAIDLSHIMAESIKKKYKLEYPRK